jgi:tetraprenyl-beta-curcumene synthase
MFYSLFTSMVQYWSVVLSFIVEGDLAIVCALEPTTSHPDYYAFNPQHDDGGYLREFVEVCRGAAASLPCFDAVALRSRAAAVRAMESQGFNHAVIGSAVSEETVTRWAYAQAPTGSGMRWWEIVGAAGSSLVVFALLAAATRPQLREVDVQAIERLYFPWAGALLALVDSLNDQASDAQDGTHSLIGRYDSTDEATERIAAIAARSLVLADEVPQPEQHALIIAAMVSMFASEPEASRPEASEATTGVLKLMGDLAWLPLLLLRMRRRLSALLTPATADA